MPSIPEERSEHVIRFIREQDGVPERELKAILAVEFSKIHFVDRAYLVLAEYINPVRQSVALGLRMKTPENAAPVVRLVTDVFSRMFGVNQALDIIVLSENQELHMAGVCRPFFSV